MNTQLTDKIDKPNPWKSATLCLAMAIAAPSYFMTKFVNLMDSQQGDNRPYTDELRAIFNSQVWDFSKVTIALAAVSLIFGILNIVFVMKGGKKWTLILSLIGILISLAVIGLLVFGWAKINAQV